MNLDKSTLSTTQSKCRACGKRWLGLDRCAACQINKCLNCGEEFKTIKKIVGRTDEGKKIIGGSEKICPNRDCFRFQEADGVNWLAV